MVPYLVGPVFIVYGAPFLSLISYSVGVNGFVLRSTGGVITSTGPRRLPGRGCPLEAEGLVGGVGLLYLDTYFPTNFLAPPGGGWGSPTTGVG